MKVQLKDQVEVQATSRLGALVLSLATLVTAMSGASAFAAVDFAAIAGREHLSSAQQNTLKDGNAVVKTVTRGSAGVRAGTYNDFSATQTMVPGLQNEALSPIFRELTVYRLSNGTPAQVAGVFTSYSQYGRLFNNVNMRSATVIANNSSPGNLSMDTRFVIAIRFLDAIDLTVAYDLRNAWDRFNSTDNSETNPDSYRVRWSFLQSPEGVHFVEGLGEFIPVTVDGVTKTLIKYYNYINPVDDRSAVVGTVRSIRNSGFIALLNSNPARTQNRDQLILTVNTIANEAQTASSINVSTVCTPLPIASCH